MSEANFCCACLFVSSLALWILERFGIMLPFIRSWFLTSDQSSCSSWLWTWAGLQRCSRPIGPTVNSRNTVTGFCGPCCTEAWQEVMKDECGSTVMKFCVNFLRPTTVVWFHRLFSCCFWSQAAVNRGVHMNTFTYLWKSSTPQTRVWH